MGINAKLLINARHGAEHVEKVLKAIGAIQISTEPKVDHAYISFKWGVEERKLYVRRSNDYGGLDGTILSFNQWGEATEILQRLGEVFGGFLCKDDSVDDWTAIQEPHNGNARFILDYQIMVRGLTQKDASELSNAVARATDYK